MKILVAILLIGAGAFYWQRHQGASSSNAPETATNATPAASLTPRPVYEHDWAKHSLDRTHEVMDQVQQTRKENEQP